MRVAAPERAAPPDRVAPPEREAEAPLLSDGHRLGERAVALGRALAGGFKHNDLLTYASAISFQILTAIIPFLLFVLALAGIFHANEIWRLHLEPKLQANLSPAVFRVVNDGVNTVFGGHRLLWATGGGLLALWQVSGAVRAVMGALARVYGAPGERPFARRYWVSFALSLEISGCFVLVATCLLFAPFIPHPHPGVAWRIFGLVVRWGLVILLLGLIVALLVRHAPARAQTVPWVTVGASIVIVSWVIVSLLFYVYLVDVASYQSLFGSLASAIVAMAYLYLSTTVFLFGAQLDAIIRTQATGCPAGVEPE
jgi:membrane protein